MAIGGNHLREAVEGMVWDSLLELLIFIMCEYKVDLEDKPDQAKSKPPSS